MTDRELDALVAEKVMGWERLPSGEVWNGPSDYVLKPFSTDISAAWSVVERLAELGWSVHVTKHPIGCGVSVSKSLAMEHGDAMRVSCGLPEVTGVEVPRCICLAALRALGMEVEP